jgi:hypothetical protein
MVHDVLTNGLQMIMVRHVAATGALVGIANGVVVNDIVAMCTFLTFDSVAGFTRFDVAIANGEVLTCNKFHDGSGDFEINSTLNLWEGFQVSFGIRVCYH